MAIQSNFPSLKPTLLLDFANTKQLDPRITFTRASTATYYDGKTTAKAEQNLIRYSQELDNNTFWPQTNVTVTANSSVAPDGTTTAELVVPNTTSAGHQLTNGNTNNPFTTAANAQTTLSIFAKANGYNFIRVQLSGTGGNPLAYFDLQNGTVGTVQNNSGTVVSTAITSVGNGWYRCVVSATPSAGNLFTNVIFLVTNADNVGSFAGDGTSGVLVWGAQVEQRSSVTAYTATTTAPITNYIPALQTAASGVARFDNNPTTGESLGLLIEEQRTNLLTYSEQFDNAVWSKPNTTVSANLGIAPDGTLSADLIKPTSSGLDKNIQKSVITITNATAYTATVYVKANGINFIYFADINNAYNNVWFNLSNGTTSTPMVGTASMTSVGDGWWRCSQTTTSTSTTGIFFVGLADSSGSRTSTANGDNGVLLWGAQLEAGGFATSYIATTSAQVTRAADSASMTGTNFSSWYNAGEGTVYAQYDISGYSAFNPVFDIGSDQNNLITMSLNSAANSRLVVLSGGTTQVNLPLGVVTANTPYKQANAYRVDDFAATRNGASVLTDTSGTIPVVNQAAIGGTIGLTRSLNGHISRIAYYPLRVTNAQLQALTS